MPKRRNDLGDCFPVAAQLLTYEYHDDPTARLVHGWPILTAGPLAGQRHWHAWIECERTVMLPYTHADGTIEAIEYTTTYAIDRSNGKDIDWPAEVYRKLGQVERVWSYDFDTAARLMLTTKQYGPWIDEDPCE